MGSNLDQGRIDVCRQKFKHNIDHFNKQTLLLLLLLLLLFYYHYFVPTLYYICVYYFNKNLQNSTFLIPQHTYDYCDLLYCCIF
jgi:hypothetical protein